MKSVTKQLNISEDVFKNKLKCLYESGQSQSKIATLFGCHPCTIEAYFCRFGLERRGGSERQRIRRGRNIVLNDTENEILTGLLLSDMHIEQGKFQGRLTFGVLHKEFADAITNNLNSVWWNKLYPYKSNNSPNINYFCKSAYSIQLFDLHKVWYKDKIKIVPLELNTISPLVLYWWYLGDGYVCKNRNQIALCTDAFSKCENERLCSILNQTYNFSLKVDSRNRISTYGRDNICKFLGVIGSSKVKCYEYKWRI